MLVLSRKTSEAILVDDQIRITIVKISGDRVKIGIEAPSHVRIVRKELSKWEDLSFHQTGTQERTGRRYCHATV